MSVIYLFWVRHLKRYGRSRSRAIGSLGQPLLFFASLGLGLSPVFRQAGQGDYLQFLAPGIVGMSMLFTAVFSGGDLIWDRQVGVLKATLVAPVPRVTIMLGRIVGGATIALIQGVIVFAICILAGFRPHSLGAVALALFFMVLIAMTFTTLGTSIALLVSDFQGFQMTINFMVMPMFLLSGALYPLTNIPTGLKVIANMDPFAYGVDGLRSVLTGHPSSFGVAADLAVLICLTLGLLTLGARLFSKLEV